MSKTIRDAMEDEHKAWLSYCLATLNLALVAKAREIEQARQQHIRQRQEASNQAQRHIKLMQSPNLTGKLT